MDLSSEERLMEDFLDPIFSSPYDILSVSKSSNPVFIELQASYVLLRVTRINVQVEQQSSFFLFDHLERCFERSLSRLVVGRNMITQVLVGFGDASPWVGAWRKLLLYRLEFVCKSADYESDSAKVTEWEAPRTVALPTGSLFAKLHTKWAVGCYSGAGMGKVTNVLQVSSVFRIAYVELQ